MSTAKTLVARKHPELTRVAAFPIWLNDSETWSEYGVDLLITNAYECLACSSAALGLR